MRTYKTISADGHLETTAIDWGKYISKEYVDRRPQLIRREDGTEVWRIDGLDSVNRGNLYCGARYDEFLPSSCASFHFPDGTNRPGTGDAISRLREQDRDGIDAEVLFPPVAGPRFWRVHAKSDPKFHLALHQAYNSFVADFCSVAPDRLIGVATVPESGIDDAIAELKRCKQMGLKAVCLSMYPSGDSMLSDADDAFWQAALDLDMKLAPHVALGAQPGAQARPGVSPAQQGTNVGTALSGNGGGPAVWSICQFIENGTFDRFPDLKFYYAESFASWLPHWLNFVDEFYMRWYKFQDLPLNKLPSEYVRDHCRFSFIHDRTAMTFRYQIGLDLLMWGSDFPHSVSSFPDTHEVLGELFEGVPDNEKHQILVENVCTFFGLDPNKELTPTP